jgi:hypothetical protein
LVAQGIKNIIRPVNRPDDVILLSFFKAAFLLFKVYAADIFYPTAISLLFAATPSLLAIQIRSIPLS